MTGTYPNVQIAEDYVEDEEKENMPVEKQQALFPIQNVPWKLR